ncbi:putative ATP-dependent Clp protease proteolytic subunit [Colletotrichum sublineola]|uniref:ATP-dependent Clp protease proteolytic subunit n=1 Tax=Colletotrichum sublineola TaxID=1173701 RepID=A0A066XZJ3_COLSU|nr:putative ATP-dependent Clp protease proteolytic subunit [Colletotrichum sublineola]
MNCQRTLFRALRAVPRRHVRTFTNFPSFPVGGGGGSGNSPPVANIPMPYITEVSERIVCLNGAIDDTVSASIVAQLLWLESDSPDKAITIKGRVELTRARIGNLRYDDIYQVAGVNGEAGKRYALPHSSVMIHQPLGGTQGQASDILIYANQIQRIRKQINEIMKRHINKSFGHDKYSLEEIHDMMERDKYLTAEEAKEIGVIDEILTRREEKDQKEKDSTDEKKTKP